MRRLRFIMKRVIMLVILGAIINVAVAWGCELRPHTDSHSHRIPLAKTDLEWLDHRHVQAIRDSMITSSRIGYRYEGVELHDLYVESPSSAELASAWNKAGHHITYPALAERKFNGFPLYCLKSERWFLPLDQFPAIASRPPKLAERMILNGAIALPIAWSKNSFDDVPTSLPISPLWPGFAINTIFYAAILWLLFAAPGLARRRIRARRGQCPACAYPVGSSDVCTECGKPVKGWPSR